MGGSAGYARPNPRGGMASLFRSISIRSGTNNALIEHLDSYNGLCAATLEYGANQSIQNMRILTQGVDKGAPGIDTSFKNSLYWVPTDGTAAQTASPLLTEMPFHHSGILSGGRTFPVMATGGLRIELQLDEANRALLPYVPTPDTKTDASIIKEFFEPNTPIDITTTTLSGAGGFRVGDVVSMVTVASASVFLTVTKVEPGTAGGAKMKLTLENKTADKLPAGSDTIAAGTAITSVKTATYTLSNLAMVFNKVSPPEGYQRSLMKQPCTMRLTLS